MGKVPTFWETTVASGYGPAFRQTNPFAVSRGSVRQAEQTIATSIAANAANAVPWGWLLGGVVVGGLISYFLFRKSAPSASTAPSTGV